MSGPKSDSATIRERLDHPVIDNDGHMIEIEPVLYEYLSEVAGPGMVDRYKALMKDGRFWGWYNRSRDEVRKQRIKRPPHWALAGNTVDRATAMVPRLWRDRRMSSVWILPSSIPHWVSTHWPLQTTNSASTW